MTLRFTAAGKEDKARPCSRYAPCEEGGDKRLRDRAELLNEVDHILPFAIPPRDKNSLTAVSTKTGREEPVQFSAVTSD